MNSVRVERLLAELDAEVHVKTPDPVSYTTYADAATRAATAVPAPVPSVHAVQVPHVHVVQNTIETPQLQILNKYVDFLATRSDVTCSAPAPVIEHVPDDTCAVPAYLAPALVTEYFAQAHVATSQHASSGFVNPPLFYYFSFCTTDRWLTSTFGRSCCACQSGSSGTVHCRGDDTVH